MTEHKQPPRDNVVRGTWPGAEVRVDEVSDDGRLATLHGHFSTFGSWYEVDSVRDGHFMERVAPGAFKKTFAENRNGMRVTFNHGQDPQLGDKVLGSITALREDEVGAYYEVPLFDTSYNRDLLPGLKAGQYGASFRFRVLQDDFNDTATASDWNPGALPERTIKEAQVMEFGPVTYPASATATAGVRSLTDAWYMRSLGAAALEPSRGTPPPQPAATRQEIPVEAATYVTREEKVSRASELKEVITRIGTEHTGVLPTEAQQRWDAARTELDTLERDVAAWDERQALITSLATRPANVIEPAVSSTFARPEIMRTWAERDIYDTAGIDVGARTLEERDQRYRDNAMRAVEVSTYAHPDTDVPATQHKIQRILDHGDPTGAMARRVLVTGSPLYRRAFDKIVKGRGTIGLTPEEQRGTALAVGVDATGGFTVPFAFDPTIIAIGAWSGAVNPYRRSCRVVTISGTDTWNAITSTAVVATRTTEAAASTEQGPTFAQPSYIVTRVQGQITASFEMFQDRSDLASEMAVLIQEAKDNEEETSFATGVGPTATPIGVGPVNGTTGAYTSTTTIGSLALAALDFDAVEAALPVRHRFGAQWFMNRVNIRKAQTLETTGGKYFGGNQYPAVGNASLSGDGNTGLRLLGYPVNESPSMTTAATANIVIGTLLNPNSYVIVDRVGMSIQFIPWLTNSSSLATGQQALYFLWRNTAKPINVDAGRTIRYLT